MSAVVALLVPSLLLAVGLSAGSEGLSAQWGRDADLIAQIRWPRSAGAWLVGALLGLAGALAQGLFRNPLADPYLLGSASGSALAVVLWVALGGAAAGGAFGPIAAAWAQGGLALAAFLGAVVGVGLSLALAGGTGRPLVLLLAGVVVGVILGSVAELVTLHVPQALRGRQSFLLGSTGYIDTTGCWMLALTLVPCLLVAWAMARGLDALVLGTATAASLGLNQRVLWWIGIVCLSAAVGVAVAQAGLVAFVGLVAPHVVRRLWPAGHRLVLPASAWMGGALLLGADVVARTLLAPVELPVGLVTAVLGGIYLLALLHRGPDGQAGGHR